MQSASLPHKGLSLLPTISYWLKSIFFLNSPRKRKEKKQLNKVVFFCLHFQPTQNKYILYRKMELSYRANTSKEQHLLCK